MADTHPPLLAVFARNVQYLAFSRGWNAKRLATELGVTRSALSRVYAGHSRYIDPEMFTALLAVFGCDPNELLLPKPGIDYVLPD